MQQVKYKFDDAEDDDDEDLEEAEEIEKDANEPKDMDGKPLEEHYKNKWGDPEDEDEEINQEEFEEVDEDEEDPDDKQKQFQAFSTEEFANYHIKRGRVVNQDLAKDHTGMVITNTLHTIYHPCGCTVKYRQVLVPQEDVVKQDECALVHSQILNKEDAKIFEILENRNPHAGKLALLKRTLAMEDLRALADQLPGSPIGEGIKKSLSVIRESL